MTAGRVVTLSAAAGLILGGIVEATNRELSAALFGVGFVVLGAWLALEILTHRKE